VSSSSGGTSVADAGDDLGIEGLEGGCPCDSAPEAPLQNGIQFLLGLAAVVGRCRRLRP
jgi:MYXO-CTERM domain-containing protein